MKNSLLQLVTLNQEGTKLVNVQLALALANLALQFLTWNGAVAELVSTLTQNSGTIPALLEFLRVLPEELSSNRRIPITDDEYKSRTVELLTNNADDVMRLLMSLIQVPDYSNNKTLIFRCFNSWVREVNPAEIVNPTFLDMLFQSLNDSEIFDPVVDCIRSIIRETREVDDSLELIQALYPRVISLRPLILQHKDDLDTFESLTLLFTEAGEAWHMLIARAPKDFRPLVEAIAECAAYDEDLDVVKYTFYFWNELQNMITLDRYNEAREDLGEIFLRLIEILISHLQYPTSGNTADPFNGNREAEEKFKSFRHEMGDVLKDCCRVVGSTSALRVPYQFMQNVLQAQPASASWQSVEAALFGVRSMGREIDPSENDVMPQIMKLIDTLPEHSHVRYTATLVIGRYTEWSLKHPEFLELQVNYVTAGFSHQDADVVNAAALALRDICYDCGPLLVNYIDQLYPFYEEMGTRVGTAISWRSYFTVTKAIAYIIASQPIAEITKSLERFGEPICERLVALAILPEDPKNQRNIADQIDLLEAFVRGVRVDVPIGSQNPLTKFVLEVLPILDRVIDQHGNARIVTEGYCRFVRSSILECRTDLLSVLPSIAEKLVNLFEKTRFGSYLWITGSIIREFSTEDLGEHVISGVWQFAERQMASFLQYLSSITDFREIPDLFDDFFLMMGDVVLAFPFRLIASVDLFVPIYEAAFVGLDLYETEPVVSVLRFLIDLFGYGSRYPPTSAYREIPENVRNLVLELVAERGGQLFNKLVLGLIHTLPRDAEPDASTLMINILQLGGTGQAVSWVAATLDGLPAESVSTEEKNKLLEPIAAALASGNLKKIRTLIKDFVSWYRRRNLSPRGVAGNNSRGSSR